MTVGELQKELDGFPSDAEVTVLLGDTAMSIAYFNVEHTESGLECDIVVEEKDKSQSETN